MSTSTHPVGIGEEEPESSGTVSDPLKCKWPRNLGEMKQYEKHYDLTSWACTRMWTRRLLYFLVALLRFMSFGALIFCITIGDIHEKPNAESLFDLFYATCVGIGVIYVLLQYLHLYRVSVTVNEVQGKAAYFLDAGPMHMIVRVELFIYLVILFVCLGITDYWARDCQEYGAVCRWFKNGFSSNNNNGTTLTTTHSPAPQGDQDVTGLLHP